MKNNTFTTFAAAVVAAGMVAAPRLASAQSVLPLPAPQASTVPANGDVNPYGVAFVPDTVATDGLLKHGGILVSNFNNNQNLQGTGTTIVQITPDGKNTLFFTSGQSGLTGMTAALGILSNGIVLAGYLPSSDGTSATAQPGGLFVIDRSGRLLGKLNDPTVFSGPWGMAINDNGSGSAQVFVSNVLNGTVVRLDVGYDGDGEGLGLFGTTVVGTGFQHSGDPAAFELGPSGLAYDAEHSVLYVASEIDSAVYSIIGAARLRGNNEGTGSMIYQDLTHLHGPLDLTLLPNGDLLVANSDGHNVDPNQPSELVEFTTDGKFVAEYPVDPNNGGAFGVAVRLVAPRTLRLAAVDDNQNVLFMWTTVVH